MRATAAQTLMELRLGLRRAENILVTVFIPLVLLIFLASLDVIPGEQPERLRFLVPSILALAIMSTSLVSLSIATGYERHYGVLKRLGGSPLTRSQLLTAKIGNILLIEIVQVILLVGTAVVGFGWRPVGGFAGALLALLLGTAAFGGIGLALAGNLRAEGTLAVANGLYVLLVLFGGLFTPVDALPAGLATVAAYLPTAALAGLLRASLSGAGDWFAPTIVLAGWAIVSITVAVRTFKWE